MICAVVMGMASMEAAALHLKTWYWRNMMKLDEHMWVDP